MTVLLTIVDTYCIETADNWTCYQHKLSCQQHIIHCLNKEKNDTDSLTNTARLEVALFWHLHNWRNKGFGRFSRSVHILADTCLDTDTEDHWSWFRGFFVIDLQAKYIFVVDKLNGSRNKTRTVTHTHHDYKYTRLMRKGLMTKTKVNKGKTKWSNTFTNLPRTRYPTHKNHFSVRLSRKSEKV